MAERIRVIFEFDDRKAKQTVKGLEKDTKKLGDTAKKAGGNFQGIFDAIKKFGPALTAGAGLTLLVRQTQDLINKASESQKVLAQQEAVLRSTAGAAGFSARQLELMADEFADLTAFSDEAVGSLQNVLLTFTNITGPVFKDAIEVILDMSAALGTNLQSSAIQVGKALQDPILGVSALAEVGVNFDAVARENIRSLVRMGETAEAQRLILEELRIEFGGSAVAAVDTYAGQVAQLTNEFDDLKASAGEGLLPTLTEVTRFFREGFDDINDVNAAMEVLGAETVPQSFNAFFKLADGTIVSRNELLEMANAARNTWSPEMVKAAGLAGSVAGAVGSIGDEASESERQFSKFVQQFEIDAGRLIVAISQIPGQVFGAGFGGLGGAGSAAPSGASSAPGSGGQAVVNPRADTAGTAAPAGSRQSGGPLFPVTLVGEQGPELVVNGVVIPTGLTRRLMALGLAPQERRQAGGLLGPLIDGQFASVAAAVLTTNPEGLAVTGGGAVVRTATSGGGGGGGTIASPTGTSGATTAVTQQVVQAVVTEALPDIVAPLVQASVRAAITPVQNRLIQQGQQTEQTNALLTSIRRFIRDQANREDMRQIFEGSREGRGF